MGFLFIETRYLKSHFAWLRANWEILTVLLIAFGTRFVDLGRQSYWFDEAGVALAAAQTSVGKALEIAQSHVAAMPLDYLIAWGMGRFSLMEYWLRLPSACFGVATILVVYRFAKTNFGKPVSFITSLLLALAPILVEFSQELRFYSGLMFFYWLLTFYLYRACKESAARDWRSVFIVSVLGAYFHLYTLLAWTNGAVFVLLFAFQKRSMKKLFVPFFLSLVGAILCVLPGYFYFGTENISNYVLLWDKLLGQILVGIGWFPTHITYHGFALGACFCLLSLIGVWNNVLNHRWDMVGLFLSAAVQILFITLADVAYGYFFAARQYLFLLPIVMLFVAFSIVSLGQRTQPLLVWRVKAGVNFLPVNRLLAVILFVSIIGLNTWVLSENYRSEKSNAREMSEYLHQNWVSGDLVWVIPSYEPLLYKFYLEYFLSENRISEAMSGLTWNDLSPSAANSRRVFMISEPPTTVEQLLIIQSMGFLLINQYDDPRLLWIRQAR